MSGCKTDEEREFYIRLCIKENYSKRQLERQLDSGYYERYMLSKETLLPESVKKLGENPFLYRRGLQCLVAIELKICKFKPEYISKLDFYLEALDRQVKKENENPSVGLLLCAAKNDEVVEYAMSRTMSPMLVSQYQL